MKTTKRILKIEIERMDDESPDTSWLGEYSDARASEFSIDRAHDENCQTQSQIAKDAINKLERVFQHLSSHRQTIGNDSYNPYYWGIDDAIDIIANAQDKLAECDCGHESGDHREYRYFNPSCNYVDANGNLIDGNTPEDIRKYVAQDYARMEDLNNSGWGFIGIRAKAKIAVNSIQQTITSGGLWGIESDSDDSCFAEVQSEELADLRAQLYALGFSKRAVAAAIKESEASQ